MFEAHGIATCSLTALPEITARVGPPRSLAVPFPLGHPLGSAADPALQRRVLAAVLALLEGPARTCPAPFPA